MAIDVTVLGCGEAFDNDLFNTSLLVHAGEAVMLFDCGYAMPPRVWQALPDHSRLDLIYISHAHADHYFGLPAVLGRMWDEKRTKPLTIVSQKPVLDQIRQMLEIGYAGLAARFEYPIEYVAADPSKPLDWRGMQFRFAPTKHAATNLAVRLEADSASVCYSGDGMITDESRRLYEGVDLLIHEAYSFEKSPVHGDIPDVLSTGAKRIALVHVQRDVRRRESARIEEAMASARVPAIMPQPGDRL